MGREYLFLQSYKIKVIFSKPLELVLVRCKHVAGVSYGTDGILLLDHLQGQDWKYITLNLF